ncbi:MAG: hypothetical protein ABI051_03605 [Vicinamibacterales bacterium]
MNIRFTSSLTPEDENAIVPAILTAVSGILDLLPIAYVIRIDTSDARVYQRSSPNPPRAVASSGHPPSTDPAW